MVLYARLTADRKAAFLALGRALAFPFFMAFWLGSDFNVFMITTSTHLLFYDVTDVYSSRLMWWPLNMCQSVHFTLNVCDIKNLIKKDLQSRIDVVICS